MNKSSTCLSSKSYYGSDCYECKRLCCNRCFLISTYWPKVRQYKLYCKECYLSLTYHRYCIISKLLYQPTHRERPIESGILRLIANYVWSRRDQYITCNDLELSECRCNNDYINFHSIGYTPKYEESKEMDLVKRHTITCFDCYNTKENGNGCTLIL